MMQERQGDLFDVMELDEYDAAEAAARLAADLGDDSDSRAAQNYLTFINNKSSIYNAIQTRKNNALEFYVSYDN